MKTKKTTNEQWLQWYDNFVDYVMQYNINLYNSACEYADESEEIEYSCCNVEVKGIIEDIRICPECKEHF